jgi:hypothetical protein
MLLEKKLSIFMDNRIEQRRGLSRAIILNQAIAIDPMCFGGPHNPIRLQRMKEWYKRFCHRLGYAQRKPTSVGQKLPAGWEEKWKRIVTDFIAARSDPKLVEEYRAYMKMYYPNVNVKDVKRLPLSLCGNADQTPVWIEPVRGTVLAHKGARSVLVRTGGKEKDRITAMLGVMYDGKKLPPYLIFRGKSCPSEGWAKATANSIARELGPLGTLGHVQQLSADGFRYPTKGISYSVNEDAYFTVSETLPWAAKSLNKRWGANTAIKAPALLHLDEYKVHQMEFFVNSLQNKHNTTVKLIDGGLTCKVQLLDFCGNRLFKV